MRCGAALRRWNRTAHGGAVPASRLKTCYKTGAALEVPSVGDTGRRLRERRKAAEMAQEALARAVPCSLATVQRLEAGKGARPSLRSAQGIARALGCTVDDLWPAGEANGDAHQS